MKLALVFVAGLVATAAGQSCGQRNTYSVLESALLNEGGDTYIVGGTEAKRGEFPWQISFQIHYSDSWWSAKKWLHNCGGSIINDQWFLTAAHCMVLPGTRDYRAVAGAHYAERSEAGQQVFNIDRIIMHSGWNEQTVANDIALVKINGRFRFDGAKVAPVCLPSLSDSTAFNGKTCVTTGWGKTTHNGIGSDRLLKVDLPVVSNSVCQSRYRNVMGAQITDTKICAGYLNRNGLGVCQGDSGGPLTCVKDGAYFLAGITSFGVICGSGEHPAVYTRVSQYKSWIDSNVARD